MANTDKEALLGGLTFDEVKQLTARGLPLDQIKDLGRAGFTFDQIDELADNLPRGSGGLSKEDLTDVVTAATRSAAEAGSEGMRRVLHPQNAQHPHISAFSHPEGNIAHPKAALTRTSYFCGARLREDQMTPREIDLVNAIDRSYTARDGRWTADVVGVGKNEALHLFVPCKSIDDRMNLPSLELVCLELVKGQAAVDPLSLAARVAELEKQLAAAGRPSAA